MKNQFKLATVAAFALALTTSGAVAQDLLGTTALNDTLDDIDRDVARDQARANDALRFGNPAFRPGLSGSASLSYSGKTGNNESQDLTIGTRLRYAAGPMVQTIGVAIDFQEADNTATKEDIFMVYDANYYFNDQFYAFALARLQTDGLADTGTATQPASQNVEKDAFVGIGPGYRIFNTEQMTWRMQAGIGKSYLKYGDGRSESEVAGIVSSRVFYGFNDNMFLTMDTDVLKSDSALRVNNDLGLNFKMTDAFSTRVSYLTEYNDSRATRSDNKLGVSLVYGF
jgi:putative salt-induced outer membrane protein